MMMTIFEFACGRCGVQRRVRLFDGTLVCLNCRLRRQVFTESELVRLTMYRAAVRAGLYSDDLRLTPLACDRVPAAGCG